MSEDRRALSRNEMHDIISALDAAGWAIVPQEPTEEMARAGLETGQFENGVFNVSNHAPKGVYRDMVEAGRVKP